MPLARKLVTVRQVIDAYVTDLKQRGARVSRNAENLLSDFSAFCGAKLATKISPGDVERWWASHPNWSPNTRFTTGTYVRAAFSAALKVGTIPVNPLALLRLPTPESRGAECIVTPEAHQQLVAIATPPVRDVLVTLYRTGTRPSNVFR